MDWLGGGDSIVNHSFFRASDDDLAALGNWDGYTEAALTAPGADVNNILVENSEFSTSISNVVQTGMAAKNLSTCTTSRCATPTFCTEASGHAGKRLACSASGARTEPSGDHSGVTFENLLLDNWYSLAQMEQEKPSLHGFTFQNIWALDQPPLAESTITGDVSDVTFDNVKYGQTRVTSDAQMPLVVSGGAAQPTYAPAPALVAAFTVDPQIIAPRQKVTLTAQDAPGAQYTWLFGDGSSAHGRRVRHRFPDALGTELDGRNGAGRFRVLLHVTDKAGHQDWAAQGIVAVGQWHDAMSAAASASPGLSWKIFSGTWTELPDFSTLEPALTGQSADLAASAKGLMHYATVWDGFIKIPADGGYTFHLIDRDGARLEIDGMEVAKTGPPFGLVCGSPGNAVRYDRGSLGLRAGLHAIHVEALNTASDGAPRLMWEGPSTPLADVPTAALSH